MTLLPHGSAPFAAHRTRWLHKDSPKRNTRQKRWGLLLQHVITVSLPKHPVYG
jgi:hypothetical protein